MAPIAEIGYALWHFGGGVGWHWQDLLSALLALIAVTGLALAVAGRTARQRAIQEQTVPWTDDAIQTDPVPQAQGLLVVADSRLQRGDAAGLPPAAIPVRRNRTSGDQSGTRTKPAK